MGSSSNALSLALDLGNSSAKAALFRGGEMQGEVVRFGYEDWERADELATNHGVTNIVYSSVANVPPREVLDKWTAGGRRIYAVRRQLPLPFPSWYRTPGTLGQDRIAAIAGWLVLREQYPKAPSGLIVDAGTCITADLVDADGVHRGGNISPGLRMRLRAMHTFTARLPLPEVGDPAGAVGGSTEEALRHGGQLGPLYELEALFARLTEQHPDLLLVLTGGDGAWLSDRLTVPVVYRPHLVLRGLIALMSDYVHNES